MKIIRLIKFGWSAVGEKKRMAFNRKITFQEEYLFMELPVFVPDTVIGTVVYETGAASLGNQKLCG